MDKATTDQEFKRLASLLIAEMNPEGYWTGRLSGSALATAVAIVALKTVNQRDDFPRITSGYDWLLKNINEDGSFGDTPESTGNVSTTLLCYAAITCCQVNGNGTTTLKQMEAWLNARGITSDPLTITRSVLNFYGKDLTFSVPILSMLHLSGVISSSSLRKIPGLPFELTLLPTSFFRFLNLRMVSYALPALIGVGIYLYTRKKKGKFSFLSVRNLFIDPAIRKLNSLVPESGGFLEAIPLTGFVAMCLVASGKPANLTVRKGTEFLRRQQREDGSWPIDTDLSTWVTTLSVKALANDPDNPLAKDQKSRLREHLLSLQYQDIHPFNGAKPGGWGWTSYSGSVPDADDTPGALLALLELYSGTKREEEALINGCRWLTGLQNSDGGFPTFCKGWGRLPFDKSCADLTGHALLALSTTHSRLGSKIDQGTKIKMGKSISKAIRYLETHQHADGSWIPLWFGNQLTDDQTNPVYGTARVCTYLLDGLKSNVLQNYFPDRLLSMVKKAEHYLISMQNPDGSWGGKKGVPGTIEETALAVAALTLNHQEACKKGLQWLGNQKSLHASPIGLYFALLWYDEIMYPLVCYTEALRRTKESWKGK